FLVDVAASAIKKAKGLSGRKELSANEGMLFIFSPPSQRTFWMKNMLIPIDIIWINEGVVVGIENQVDPEIKTSLYKKQRYSSPERVDYVLEIAGGRAEELNIQKGSKAHISFK
ncbi:DUF192 domain-containing protein, partial [Patescibacteria group bacterium]|nr:DUF192 domain-containing protein [Patescibacteria group bacterium]